MTKPFQIGFVGMGKMAQAIWAGMSRAKLAQLSDVSFYDISTEQCESIQTRLGIQYRALSDLVAVSDVILFCVKPQNISELLLNFPKSHLDEKLFISILAGIPIQTFESYLGDNIQMLRVMPNTPALVHAGMSALAFNAMVAAPFQEFAKEIFSSFGKIEMMDESLLDVATGISGSGPAFFYRIAHTIAQVGPEYGLDYAKALNLVAQTLVGAGAMLLESGRSPEDLIRDVSSPNGTTVAGLSLFDQTAIDTDIQKVIRKTIERSKELGK